MLHRSATMTLFQAPPVGLLKESMAPRGEIKSSEAISKNEDVCDGPASSPQLASPRLHLCVWVEAEWSARRGADSELDPPVGRQARIYARRGRSALRSHSGQRRPGANSPPIATLETEICGQRRCRVAPETVACSRQTEWRDRHSVHRSRRCRTISEPGKPRRFALTSWWRT